MAQRKWWWDFSVILIYRISVIIVYSHLDLGMFEIALHTITWAMPNVIWCESLFLNSVHFYKGLPIMYSIVSNKDLLQQVLTAPSLGATAVLGTETCQ